MDCERLSRRSLSPEENGLSAYTIFVVLRKRKANRFTSLIKVRQNSCDFKEDRDKRQIFVVNHSLPL